MKKAALLAVLVLASCGKKEPSVTPGGGPPPAASSPRMGASGGTVTRGGAKLVVPPGALVREQEVDLVESKATVFPMWKPAGQGFEVHADQATFPAPLELVLPVDAPPGTKAEQIVAVMAQGSLAERLEGTADLAARTLTVKLKRLVPLANGSEAGEPGPVTVQAAVEPEYDAPVAGPEGTFRCERGLPEAAAMVEATRKAHERIRPKFQPMPIAMPTALDIRFRKLPPNYGAQASGGRMIEINADTWLRRDDDDRAGILAHEYFHLMQQIRVEQNLMRLSPPPPADFAARGAASWVYEATATWMSTHLFPQANAVEVSRLFPDFCFKPLNEFEPPVGNPHQYAAFVFFSWIDETYPDAEALVLNVWREYLGGRIVKDTLENDASRGRGCFNPLDVLDTILQETPDRTGRKRNLREVFADFLLHYNWARDFEPLESFRDQNRFAANRELDRAPDSARLEWTMPYDSSTKRELKRSETVSGGPFAIVKSIRIDSTCGDTEEGDLTISLVTRGNAGDSLLIVFPSRDGKADPEIGNSKNPVVIPDWHKKKGSGAIVWVVDLSVQGNFDHTVTAEMGAQEKSKGGDQDLSFNLSFQTCERGGSRGEGWVCLRLSLDDIKDRAELEKTPEGIQRIFEIEQKRLERIEKEFGRDAWLHLVVTVAGKPNHLYCPAGGGEGGGPGYWTGNVLVPLAPGTYPVEAKVSLLGKTVTAKTTLVLEKLISSDGDPAERLVEAKSELDQLRKKLEELSKEEGQAGRLEYAKNEIAAKLRLIGSLQEALFDEAAARAAYKEAMALGSEPDQKTTHRFIANLDWSTGQLDSYRQEIVAAGDRPEFLGLAKKLLVQKNDIAGARAALVEGGYDTDPNAGFLVAPPAGARILK